MNYLYHVNDLGSVDWGFSSAQWGSFRGGFYIKPTGEQVMQGFETIVCYVAKHSKFGMQFANKIKLIDALLVGGTRFYDNIETMIGCKINPMLKFLLDVRPLSLR